MGSASMTVSGGYAAVAESTELKPKQVKAVITSYMELAASELKKNGAFKIGGVLNMKLKKKPAKPARKGVNPFTKEPCVFKAKPASKTVRCLPMKKLKEMINWGVFGCTDFVQFQVSLANQRGRSHGI